MQEVVIDVSDLPPPEPMTNILLALARLQTSQYLKVVHRRQPFPLFEKLLEAQWLYYCHQCEEQSFHIYIYRAEMSTAVNQLIKQLS